MNTTPPPYQPPSEPLDRHEARRQRREARRAAFGTPGRGRAWIGGLILVLLGVVFLLQNMGIYILAFNNWWALFILIPAVSSFDAAFQAYRRADNVLDTPARNSLLVGLFLSFLAGIFLFNLNLNLFGPVMIILAGLGILSNAILPKSEE